jgi:hypothetical protein
MDSLHEIHKEPMHAKIPGGPTKQRKPFEPAPVEYKQQNPSWSKSRPNKEGKETKESKAKKTADDASTSRYACNLF